MRWPQAQCQWAASTLGFGYACRAWGWESSALRHTGAHHVAGPALDAGGTQITFAHQELRVTEEKACTHAKITNNTEQCINVPSYLSDCALFQKTFHGSPFQFLFWLFKALAYI